MSPEIICRVKESLAVLFKNHGVDESHGIQHAEAVLAHAELAIRASPSPLDAQSSLAVSLAALLHDADDRKYFKPVAGSLKELQNATRIMQECGVQQDVLTKCLQMISLVSCSKNGNSCPTECVAKPFLLWPRWADRLEAAGEIGVARCYMYNRHIDAPLDSEHTPKPLSVQQIFEFANEERFKAYQASGGVSNSFMDHFYDKLLQVARPPSEIVRNPYLEAEAERRVAPLIAVCLAYGKTGKVPIDLITSMTKSDQE